jgi:hypothetical protein
MARGLLRSVADLPAAKEESTMASKTPGDRRAGSTGTRDSARNPNRLKTGTGSTRTRSVDELGPELRGGPSHPAGRRQADESPGTDPMPDADVDDEDGEPGRRNAPT